MRLLLRQRPGRAVNVDPALVLALAALVIALGALALAIGIGRQSARALTDLRAHRRAHANAHGTADPVPVRPSRPTRRDEPTGLIPAQPPARRQERPRP